MDIKVIFTMREDDVDDSSPAPLANVRSEEANLRLNDECAALKLNYVSCICFSCSWKCLFTCNGEGGGFGEEGFSENWGRFSD